MEITHSWDVWKELTVGLERKGKLNELETVLARTASRPELYNEVLKIATTVEEILILAYYAGYRRGAFETMIEMKPPRVVG